MKATVKHIFQFLLIIFIAFFWFPTTIFADLCEPIPDIYYASFENEQFLGGFELITDCFENSVSNDSAYVEKQYNTLPEVYSSQLDTGVYKLEREIILPNNVINFEKLSDDPEKLSFIKRQIQFKNFKEYVYSLSFFSHLSPVIQALFLLIFPWVLFRMFKILKKYQKALLSLTMLLQGWLLFYSLFSSWNYFKFGVHENYGYIRIYSYGLAILIILFSYVFQIKHLFLRKYSK